MKFGRKPNHDLSGTGMRRIDWVRLTVGNGPTTAEAIGVGHRQPATRPLPLPVAARLTAEGVPFLVRHLSPDTSNGSASTEHRAAD